MLKDSNKSRMFNGIEKWIKEVSIKYDGAKLLEETILKLSESPVIKSLADE